MDCFENVKVDFVMRNCNWALPNMLWKIIVHLFRQQNTCSLRPKMYDVLNISHLLINAINIMWKRDIMSYIIKLSSQ